MLYNMNTSTASRTCFVAAPAGANLGVLRSALERRGLQVLVPHELSVGADWASEIQKQIAQADLVIGVLTADRQSPWVLFELGQASALGRRIVLITSPKADPVPFSLHQFLVLRIDVDNSDAIDFALDQLLSAPRPTSAKRSVHAKTLAGLGPRSDELMLELERSLARSDWRSVEKVVAEALRSSGADIVVASPDRDLGVDLAVWSDVLEPFVGNPLLIEIKGKVRSTTDVIRAATQLAAYVGVSGSQWGLLLYGEAPNLESQSTARIPPNVLALSLSSLFESLKTRAFPEVVRDLRNRRVHGVGL